jgi:protein SCO1/2
VNALRHISALAFVGALAVANVRAGEPPQRAEPLPPELEKVGIDEQLGETIPLDLEFVDEHGKSVRLRDYFTTGRPVVLNLGYYRCPMLCGLVLNGLVDAVAETELAVGNDYAIVTVSVDPNETHRLAYLKKKSVLQAIDQPGAAKGWHFLTGEHDAIAKLTDAAGFGYQWVERRGEFAHAAVLIVLTPEGRIARYLYGIKYPARTYRLSLVEAAAGEIGSTLDKVLLYCFQYDRHAGQYTPAAMNLMRGGAVFTMLLVGTGIWLALRRESKRHRRATTETGDWGAA